jgi:hypothetical protein
MRGPGLKSVFDVRRTWRCRACGYERHADGRLTSVRCQCSDRPFMQLVAEPRQQRSRNKPVDCYIDAEQLLAGED